MGEVVEAFDAVACERPDAVAVVADDATWSYGRLQDESRRLARELQGAGVRPGDVVGLAVGRTALHVAAMLAAWRARAAFLPLDPAAPDARVRACLQESRARVLLASGACVERLPDAGAPLGREGERLAYVIYTSGSTGAPKGVRISHDGLLPLARAQIRAFGLGRGKRATACLSLAFDASISDILTALLSGASLVVLARAPAPSELADVLRIHGVTHADLPPSLLPLVDPATLPSTLETVIIGGEVCPPAAVRAWARRVRVVNVYGPTEATICTSLGACDAETWERPLLGEPLAHVAYRVEGEELCIGGLALALGYVDRPDLDALRFVSLDGARYYRTGDRVRRTADGGLEFLGRLDRQVKVRGRLVSPEEIEARLRELEEVADAAVVLDRAERDVLTAHVVLRDGSALDARGIVARLAASLPEWMLPRVVLGAAVPRNATGKVDHGAIGDRRTRVVAEAFERVLGVTGVGSEDDFVALGGDSLAALEVVAEAQLAGVAVDVAAVLTARTPAAIARAEAGNGGRFGELRATAERLVAELEPAVARGQGAPGGDWLVTGATGFLGRHLLPRLLEHTDGTIHCLVRATDDIEARARLCPSHPRVVAIAGDVAAPGLGLTFARWSELAARVGHVVHGAAAVNLALSAAALGPTNVRGALEVARFVRAGRPKVLTHVSSLAVLVATDARDAVVDERSTLAPDARVFGGYAQTKVVAEEILRRAVPDACVVRPGLVTGERLTGRGAARCPLASFLRALVALGCLPRGDHESLRVDVTPVDDLARTLAALLALPARPSVVHVASARGASLADLVRAARARVPIEDVSPERFLARARAALPRGDALAFVAAAHRLLGEAAHRDLDLFLHTDRRFDVSLARDLTGFPSPVVDHDLLVRYVDAAREPAA